MLAVTSSITRNSLIDNVLARLSGVKRAGNGYGAHCPSHQDDKQSLSIREGDDGRILLHCHAGCDVRRIVTDMGLTMSDLFPRQDRKPHKGRIASTYDYHDRDGNLLFQVCRTENKGFFQRRPDGKGGWINGLGTVDPVLYRLPALIEAAKKGAPVFIAEGEKDCDNLAAQGMTSTTNPMGAGKWRDYYSDYLKDASVIVFPDNDKTGREHAQAVAKSLWGKATRIKVVELPDLPEKGDISDWLAAGGTREELLRICKAAELWQPPAEEDSWPDPEPLSETLLPVEGLPPGIIPGPLREWATDVAYRMQAPVDFIAAGLMVMAGAVIGAGCGIKPKQKDDWLVVPNLWGGVIARPGMLKTPALQETMKPLVMLEAAAKKQYDEDSSQYEAEREVFRAQKDAIKTGMTTAAKGKGGDDLDDLKSKYLTLEPPEEPIWRRFKTNDSTIEKVAELLQQNPRGILLFRDELVGLLTSWDKEGRESDRAFYLEAWNGYGSHTSDRISRGTVHVDNLCVSILGGIQPAKLLAYLYQAASALENDGLIQRMQLMIYPDEPTEWELVDEYPNREARDRVFRVIETLAEMDFTRHGAELHEGEKIPHVHFDGKAQELFNRWVTELQGRLRADESPIILEHLNKYRSLMPSLALIDHLVNVADGTASGPVALDSARRAAAWCEYLESHARRVYGLIGDISQRTAAELAKKIRGGSVQDGFTLRDIYNNGWHLLNNKESVKAACDELIDAGWLQETNVNTGGRPKVEYKINPKIFPQYA